MRHGHGILYWPDGSTYKGYFADNSFDGPGIEYASDGKMIRDGRWKKGVHVKW